MGFLQELLGKKEPLVTVRRFEKYVDLRCFNDWHADKVRELLEAEGIKYRERLNAPETIFTVHSAKFQDAIDKEGNEGVRALIYHRHEVEWNPRVRDIEISGVDEGADDVAHLQKALRRAGCMVSTITTERPGRHIVTTRDDMEEVLNMPENAALKARLDPYDLPGQLRGNGRH